jgi:hypothetical protein
MFGKLLPINVHPLERVARILLGLGLLALAFVGPKSPLGYLGLFPLVTGLVGTCPLYTLFGMSTRPSRAR